MSIDLLAAANAFSAAAEQVSKTASGNCCHGNSSGSVESTVKLALNRFDRLNSFDRRPGSGGNSVHRVLIE